MNTLSQPVVLNKEKTSLYIMKLDYDIRNNNFNFIAQKNDNFLIIPYDLKKNDFVYSYYLYEWAIRNDYKDIVYEFIKKYIRYTSSNHKGTYLKFVDNNGSLGLDFYVETSDYIHGEIYMDKFETLKINNLLRYTKIDSDLMKDYLTNQVSYTTFLKLLLK